MIISIAIQLKLILFSLLGGVITGILFDFYRILRGFERSNKIITFIQDALFWIFTSIIVFLFLLFTDHAYIGGYVYLYIALGIFLYIKLFSRQFLFFQYTLIRSILKAGRIIRNFIIYPFQLIIYHAKTKKNQK